VIQHKVQHRRVSHSRSPHGLGTAAAVRG
jgi:hypothetical protein